MIKETREAVTTNGGADHDVLVIPALGTSYDFGRMKLQKRNEYLCNYGYNFWL